MTDKLIDEYEVLDGQVVDFLRFCFTRPLLKTDIICKKCKGYVSLKFNEGRNGKSGWVTKRCLCGTSIKYLKSGNMVSVAKKDYDPIYKNWQRTSVEEGGK